jgi:anti-sigma factor (TIGR02949 family)
MMTEPTKHHDRKDCRKLLGSLSEYVDGELDDELCNVLEQHLEHCQDCRIVVDTLKKTVYLYHKTAPAENLPSDIRNRLFKSLNIENHLEK